MRKSFGVMIALGSERVQPGAILGLTPPWVIKPDPRGFVVLEQEGKSYILVCEKPEAQPRVWVPYHFTRSSAGVKLERRGGSATLT